MTNEYEKSTDEYLHDLAWHDYREEHGYLSYPATPYTQYEFDDGWRTARDSSASIVWDRFSEDFKAGYRAYLFSVGRGV